MSPLIKPRSNHFSFYALDGVFALGITIIGLMPHVFSGTLGQLTASKVTLADAIAGLAFVFLWQYCFSLLSLYDKFATIPSRTAAMLQGISIVMILVMTYCRFMHPSVLTWRALGTTVLALICYETLRITLSAYLLDWVAARDPRRAVILGSGRRAGKAWRAIRIRYRSSIQLLGFVDDREPGEMSPDVASRYLGGLDELSSLLLREVVDLILIAMPIKSCYPLMQRAVHIAESAGVRVVYLDDIYSTRKQNVDPQSIIFRELAPDQEHYLIFLAAKRVVDVVGAAIGLVFLSPLFLCLAIGVKATSGGPVFFCQERYGYRRRRFKMIKFRSMVHNAEMLLPDLEHANEASGPIFKMRNDPRVTRFGRLIRSTSLDELPQLWNVLTGDMSLVGPRPMSVRDVSLFDEAALMRRFSVRPGMTGLWQVSGRSEVGFDEWVRMDNRYIDGWSLGLDLKILARTVGTVIKRSGAI